MVIPLLCAALALGVTKAAAETLPGPAFTWDFAPRNSTDDLPSCSTYSLTAPNASLDGGQYSLRAFSPNVTPIYMDVGSNVSDLQWRVPFPPDFQVLLGMLDGNGQFGDVKGPFAISSSDDASCLSINGSTAPSFKVTTNVTTPKSCEAVGVFVSGGSPPYNVTIVIEGAAVISRAMYGNDDTYTWFNVAPSGRRIIFSAEDKEGNLAASSEILVSAGNSNLDTCPVWSYSSKYKRPWSKARKVFYHFVAWLPFTLIIPILGFYIIYIVLYCVYQLLKWLVLKLCCVSRRGDEEMGTGTNAAGTGNVDPADTRPNSPVQPALHQDDDDRPDTPTGLEPAPPIYAPNPTPAPVAPTPTHNVIGALPTNAGDEKDVTASDNGLESMDEKQ